MLVTNSKSKNKWRLLIGIVVGIGVTVGAFFAVQYILQAVEMEQLTGDGYSGKIEYIRYINGKPIRYTTISSGHGIGMDGRLANFLAEYGSALLLVALAVCMALLVLVLRSKRIWKDTECVHRKGIAYVAEVLVFALCCLPMVFTDFAWYLERFGTWQIRAEYDWGAQIAYMANLLLLIVEAQLYFFLCFWYLRPLFTLGIKGYWKEYSLLYVIGGVCRKTWKRFKAELEATDFSKKPVKLLRKAVLIQFAVLLVCVCCWFLGIPLLIVYSVALFFFLRRHYDKVETGYWEILRETRGIANGDLTGKLEGSFGMLQPLGEELERVKDGFRRAVEEEVKSQRMKTELITNVSHDLKTPLTAIMTYVELLKNEEITPEERASYVDTLDKKSKRLKVLIEDLFEVSRAVSNTVVLHPMEVDMG